MRRPGDIRRRVAAVLAILMAGPVVPASAEESAPLERDAPLEAPTLPGGTLENDGLDNLVVRRTVTALGHRFYDAFAQAWRDQPVVARGVLTIEERPWMTDGTEVVIRYQHEVIRRLRVWPRNPAPEEVARQAAAQVARVIARYQQPLNGQREAPQGLED
mgnify:CR=1 FL=1